MQNNHTVVDAKHQFVDKDKMALISAVQNGDKHAYHLLYQAHVGQVYGLCYRLTGDKMLAEDATQEVFIQLWKKIGNFKGQSQFSTWLHSVTSNVTISYLRKQKSWVHRMFNLETSSAMTQLADECVSNVDIEAYIIRLPERARIVFVLHAIEGFRHEQIAHMTGMALGTSKAQFHRAKKLLKEWMGYEN